MSTGARLVGELAVVSLGKGESATRLCDPVVSRDKCLRDNDMSSPRRKSDVCRRILRYVSTTGSSTSTSPCCFLESRIFLGIRASQISLSSPTGSTI